VFDAPALAAIQRANLVTLLGPDVADLGAAFDSAAATQTWGNAIALASPEGPYNVAVAVDESETVVGFAALGPLLDPDGGQGAAELVALWVAPEAQRQGHGSRLLSQVADAARRHLSAARLSHWVTRQDIFRQRFLHQAGFRADGAERSWQSPAGELVDEMRWSTRLD
jgi:GNAT superfamily N-acetyltransferase